MHLEDLWVEDLWVEDLEVEDLGVLGDEKVIGYVDVCVQEHVLPLSCWAYNGS